MARKGPRRDELFDLAASLLAQVQNAMRDAAAGKTVRIRVNARNLLEVLVPRLAEVQADIQGEPHVQRRCLMGRQFASVDGPAETPVNEIHVNEDTSGEDD